MIYAIWSRYVTGSRWWLVLLTAVLIADVALGAWILSWELRMLGEAW